MVRKINQIAIVVDDIQKAVKFYEEIMDIGPFQIIERPIEECELHGTPTQFQIKTALCMNEGIQIEMIQVLQGINAHSEFYEKKGPGIHHLGFFTEDIEVEIKKFTEKGINILSRGEFIGIKWVYFDTADLCGSVQEYIELPRGKIQKKKELLQ